MTTGFVSREVNDAPSFVSDAFYCVSDTYLHAITNILGRKLAVQLIPEQIDRWIWAGLVPSGPDSIMSFYCFEMELTFWRDGKLIGKLPLCSAPDDSNANNPAAPMEGILFSPRSANTEQPAMRPVAMTGSGSNTFRAIAPFKIRLAADRMQIEVKRIWDSAWTIYKGYAYCLACLSQYP